MLAVNYSTVREHLKEYCDKVTDNKETVIVTRKNEKNEIRDSFTGKNSWIIDFSELVNTFLIWISSAISTRSKLSSFGFINFLLLFLI